MLATHVGCTSSNISHALCGIPRSNSPYPGLLGLGLLEKVALDVSGVTEINYRITVSGIQAYLDYIATHKELPPLRSRESPLPWDEWFAPECGAEGLPLHGDGSSPLWELEQDTPTEKRDYSVDTNAMVAKVKRAARKRYKVVQISRTDADGNGLINSIIVQARNMTADERLGEDILRAEERDLRVLCHS